MKQGSLVRFKSSATANTPGFRPERAKSVAILVEEIEYVGKPWVNVLFPGCEQPVRLFKSDVELA